MEYRDILNKLLAEREKLEHAIAAVARLVQGNSPKRRGRPPKNPVEGLMNAAKGEAGDKKKRKAFSAETKRKMSLAQKRRYAERKKAAEAKA